jgi:hypothetical protein
MRIWWPSTSLCLGDSMTEAYHKPDYLTFCQFEGRLFPNSCVFLGVRPTHPAQFRLSRGGFRLEKPEAESVKRRECAVVGTTVGTDRLFSGCISGQGVRRARFAAQRSNHTVALHTLNHMYARVVTEPSREE